jgi:hypothetical protein
MQNVADGSHHHTQPAEDQPMVRIGFRRPSIRKRIAARTSWKRAVRHRLGLKAPRGWGWLTNPRRAAYNRIYSRTTRGCLILVMAVSGVVCTPFIIMTSWLVRN